MLCKWKHITWAIKKPIEKTFKNKFFHFSTFSLTYIDNFRAFNSSNSPVRLRQLKMSPVHKPLLIKSTLKTVFVLVTHSANISAHLDIIQHATLFQWFFHKAFILLEIPKCTQIWSALIFAHVNTFLPGNNWKYNQKKSNDAGDHIKVL